MNIDDLTLGQIKQINNLFDNPDQFRDCKELIDYVGKNMIVRTVTMIYTGKLVDVSENFLTLLECSWIPETARYSDFVSKGEVNECEPYPDDLPVMINRGSLLDLCELRKSLLPRSKK